MGTAGQAHISAPPRPAPACCAQASAAEEAGARLVPQGGDEGLDAELDEAAAAVRASLKATYLSADNLTQFAVAGGWVGACVRGLWAVSGECASRPGLAGDLRCDD
jgi:hypothetical protein